MTTVETEHKQETAVATDEQHTSLIEQEPHADAAHDEIPHLPDPSIWPITIALGMSILLVGVVVGLVVILIGVAVLALGLGGWIYQDAQVAKRGDH